MVDHQEEWQVFDKNGLAMPGQKIGPKDSRGDSSVIVGAVHVWIWRQTASGIEVLLQHRAKDKPTWPDCLDISAAGHVDAGETLIDAVLREADEEIGVAINPSSLEYIFSYRNFDNGIKWVYLLEEVKAVEYVFNDGEVQALKWVSMTEFESMAAQPKAHNLVPHPTEYFALLLKALRHFA